MFERFTERAWLVIVLAQEEARMLKHRFIGTEHLLLGLLREDEGLAARVLRSLGLTIEVVRAEVTRIVGTGEEISPTMIPFTPRSKKVLELTLREALALDHEEIDTHHILLGLLRENEGMAARLLLRFEADVDQVRRAVLTGIDTAADDVSPPPRGNGGLEAARRTRGDRGIFDRFTEGARRVVVLAQEESRDLEHDHIGSEHILLGLLREREGLAARALESLGLTPDGVRGQTTLLVGSREAVDPGRGPFTLAAREVLEQARREALTIGHNYIGTEHILLGLVRDDEGAGVGILSHFDVDPSKVRHEVSRMMAPAQQASTPGGRRRLDGVGDALLDGAGPAIREVGREIRRTHGRSPDAGDLLALLVLVPDGFAARALSELGVEREAFLDALAKARKGGARFAPLPPARLAELLAEARARLRL